MEQKKNPWVFVGVVLAAVAVLSAGYGIFRGIEYWLANRRDDFYNPPAYPTWWKPPAEETTSSSNSSAVSSAAWKTYESQQYGFAMQYPGAFDDLVTASDTRDASLSPTPLLRLFAPGNINQGNPRLRVNLVVNVYPLAGYFFRGSTSTELYGYDSKKNQCKVYGDTNTSGGIFTYYNAPLALGNLNACTIGKSTAAGGLNGYMIPLPKTKRVVEILYSWTDIPNSRGAYDDMPPDTITVANTVREL